MTGKKVYRAIGLMSGTSLDGVDAALIETDGYDNVQALDFTTIPYDDAARAAIRPCCGLKDENDPRVREAARILTEKHIDAIRRLAADDVDLIGFHGQTIYHAPQDGVTLQIGDADLLARETGIDVVHDFRSADVAAGGEGAPLAPLYHAAQVKAQNINLPCVILNIGGVSNVTYIDQDGILAFDTGPGNALMDDWAQKHMDRRFDEDGRAAAAGDPAETLLEDWLSHPYFERRPPKSLDRDEWDIAGLGQAVEEMGNLSVEDGAATLLEFTARTIIASQDFMPKTPKSYYVCGGGAHNKALMKRLSHELNNLQNVQALGWNGDAVEAECFAYLAVRSVLGEALSLPTTTGVSAPQTGGRLVKPKGRAA